jgi:hypothetical protein
MNEPTKPPIPPLVKWLVARWMIKFNLDHPPVVKVSRKQLQKNPSSVQPEPVNLQKELSGYANSDRLSFWVQGDQERVDLILKKSSKWKKTLQEFAKQNGIEPSEVPTWPTFDFNETSKNISKFPYIDNLKDEIQEVQVSSLRKYILYLISGLYPGLSLGFKGGSTLSIAYNISCRTSLDIDIKAAINSEVENPQLNININETAEARKENCKLLLSKLMDLIPNGWNVKAVFRPSDVDYKTAAVTVNILDFNNEISLLIDLSLDKIRQYKSERWENIPFDFLGSTFNMEVYILPCTLLEKLSAIEKRWAQKTTDSSFVRHYEDVHNVFNSLKYSEQLGTNLLYWYESMLEDGAIEVLNPDHECWNITSCDMDILDMLIKKFDSLRSDKLKEITLVSFSEQARAIVVTLF